MIFFCICRLAGAVKYTENHFIALCRRRDGNWEECDDLRNAKIVYNVKVPFTPTAAIYTKV